METNTAIQKAEKPSVLVALGQRYSVEPAKLLDTLKATVFKNASNEQLMALCIVANEFKLNPFLKQIYAFPDKGGGIIPVVGVDGWIALINSQPGLNGIEFIMEDDANGKPYSVTCVIHVKGREYPCKVTEYLSECARNTDPWNKSPRRMLRHRALIQCGRVAFGLAGIKDEDEAAEFKDITPPEERPQVTPPTPAKEPAKEIVIDQPKQTPQEELAEVIVGAGFNFDQFQKWGLASGNLEQELGAFHEVPTAVASRLLKAKKGMIAQLNAAKEVAS